MTAESEQGLPASVLGPEQRALAWERLGTEAGGSCSLSAVIGELLSVTRR